MNTMRKWNNVVSVITAVMGAFIITLAKKFPIKSEGDPGAGFWPLTLGTLLVICAIVLFISNIIHKDKEERKSVILGSEANKCVYSIMGIIVIFCIALYVLGFYISTLIFIPTVMYLLDTRDKKLMVITSITTVAAIYIIFGVLLKTQLPNPIFIN